MKKRILISGLLATLALVIFQFIVNGIFGFKSKIEMKQLPNEKYVYSILKENIEKPGRYIINPELTAEDRFPENEPVYSILYGGVGHEDAGRETFMGLGIFFLVSLISAWILSKTSQEVLSSYFQKVLLFLAVGFMFALFSNLMNYGIGNYPLKDSIILGIFNICNWLIIGLIISWQIKPIK